MIKTSKKVLTLALATSFAVLPNIVASAENNKNVISEAVLTESIISSSVKDIVKEHGNPNEPIIADSGYTDPKTGSKIYYYILPQVDSAARTDFSTLRSTTPISSHTIPQGVLLVYSKSNGDPWTVSQQQEVGMHFTTNQTSPTNMGFGHFNVVTNTRIVDLLQDTVYGYTAQAGATSIRFFIQNLSAGDVNVSGSISF